MDVYLMVKRKKTSIFLDCKENSTVMEIKKMIEGILKVQPENQMLYKDKTVMEDTKTVAEYNLNSLTSRAQTPSLLGLCLRDLEIGNFETLEIFPLSVPPELPEVMRTQDQSPLQTGSETK